MPKGGDEVRALEKVKQDIVSHIDARLVELRSVQDAKMEALLGKLQEELRRGTSGIMRAIAQHPQQRSQPQDSHSFDVNFEIHRDIFTDCCTAGGDEHINNMGVDVQKEWYPHVGQQDHMSNRNPRVRMANSEPVLFDEEPIFAVSAKNGLANSASQHQHWLQSRETEEPEEPEHFSEQDGSDKIPKGQFQGRQNLFAFLQCKKWDSEVCQLPETADIEPPEDKGHWLWKGFKSVINSSPFDMFIGGTIMINAIIMGLQLEYQGVTSAEKIGIEGDEGNWSNAEESFLIIEHFFTILYLIELIARLLVMGITYFKAAINWIDFVVVLAACMDLYVFPNLEFKAPDLTIIRLMRVVRIIRILRILRVIKFFTKLRALVTAVSKSMWSLIWSLILLGIVQMIGSIFMTQSLQSFLQDESEDPVAREQVFLYFGNWSRSLITMFEISIWGGTWGRCGRVVIFKVSRNYAIFFITYLALVSFAMIRVIGALFLKDTLASTAKDDETSMQEENRSDQYIHQCWTLFNQLDETKNESLSLHELKKRLEDEKICEAFHSIGVTPYEVPALFTLMDDGDDEVQFCEFLSGIMRLKNAHQGVDLPTMLYENKKLLKRVVSVGKEVKELRADFLGRK